MLTDDGCGDRCSVGEGRTRRIDLELRRGDGENGGVSERRTGRMDRELRGGDGDRGGVSEGRTGRRLFKAIAGGKSLGLLV